MASTASTSTTPATVPGALATTGRAAAPANLNADTTHGTTVVDDSVIQKIAGIAAREVAGVHDLGGGAARAIGAIRTRLNASDQGQGISVEVGETQVAVDVTVVAEYPVALHRLADDVRSAVIEAIESLVGLEVTEVNVTVSDVNIPADDDSADQAPRVQ